MLSEYLLTQLNSLMENNVLCDLDLIANDRTIVRMHQVVFTALNKRHFELAVENASTGVFDVQSKKRMMLSCLDADELRLLVRFMYGERITDQQRYEALKTSLEKVNMSYLLNKTEHPANTSTSIPDPPTAVNVKVEPPDDAFPPSDDQVMQTSDRGKVDHTGDTMETGLQKDVNEECSSNEELNRNTGVNQTGDNLKSTEFTQRDVSEGSASNAQLNTNTGENQIGKIMTSAENTQRDTSEIKQGHGISKDKNEDLIRNMCENYIGNIMKPDEKTQRDTRYEKNKHGEGSKSEETVSNEQLNRNTCEDHTADNLKSGRIARNDELNTKICANLAKMSDNVTDAAIYQTDTETDVRNNHDQTETVRNKTEDDESDKGNITSNLCTKTQEIVSDKPTTVTQISGHNTTVLEQVSVKIEPEDSIESNVGGEKISTAAGQVEGVSDSGQNKGAAVNMGCERGINAVMQRNIASSYEENSPPVKVKEECSDIPAIDSNREKDVEHNETNLVQSELEVGATNSSVSNTEPNKKCAVQNRKPLFRKRSSHEADVDDRRTIALYYKECEDNAGTHSKQQNVAVKNLVTLDQPVSGTVVSDIERSSTTAANLPVKQENMDTTDSKNANANETLGIHSKLSAPLVDIPMQKNSGTIQELTDERLSENISLNSNHPCANTDNSNTDLSFKNVQSCLAPSDNCDIGNISPVIGFNPMVVKSRGSAKSGHNPKTSCVTSLILVPPVEHVEASQSLANQDCLKSTHLHLSSSAIIAKSMTAMPSPDVIVVPPSSGRKYSSPTDNNNAAGTQTKHRRVLIHQNATHSIPIGNLTPDVANSSDVSPHRNTKVVIKNVDDTYSVVKVNVYDTNNKQYLSQAVSSQVVSQRSGKRTSNNVKTNKVSPSKMPLKRLSVVNAVKAVTSGIFVNNLSRAPTIMSTGYENHLPVVSSSTALSAGFGKPSAVVPTVLSTGFGIPSPVVSTMLSTGFGNHLTGVPTILSTGFGHQLPVIPTMLSTGFGSHLSGVPTILSTGFGHQLPVVPTILSTGFGHQVPVVPTTSLSAISGKQLPVVTTILSPTILSTGSTCSNQLPVVSAIMSTPCVNQQPVVSTVLPTTGNLLPVVRAVKSETSGTQIPIISACSSTATGKIPQATFNSHLSYPQSQSSTQKYIKPHVIAGSQPFLNLPTPTAPVHLHVSPVINKPQKNKFRRLSGPTSVDVVRYRVSLLTHLMTQSQHVQPSTVLTATAELKQSVTSTSASYQSTPSIGEGKIPAIIWKNRGKKNKISWVCDRKMEIKEPDNQLQSGSTTNILTVAGNAQGCSEQTAITIEDDKDDNNCEKKVPLKIEPHSETVCTEKDINEKQSEDDSDDEPLINVKKKMKTFSDRNVTWVNPKVKLDGTLCEKSLHSKCRRQKSSVSILDDQTGELVHITKAENPIGLAKSQGTDMKDNADDQNNTSAEAKPRSLVQELKALAKLVAENRKYVGTKRKLQEHGVVSETDSNYSRSDSEEDSEVSMFNTPVTESRLYKEGSEVKTPTGENSSCVIPSLAAKAPVLTEILSRRAFHNVSPPVDIILSNELAAFGRPIRPAPLKTSWTHKSGRKSNTSGDMSPTMSSMMSDTTDSSGCEVIEIGDDNEPSHSSSEQDTQATSSSNAKLPNITRIRLQKEICAVNCSIVKLNMKGILDKKGREVIKSYDKYRVQEDSNSKSTHIYTESEKKKFEEELNEYLQALLIQRTQLREALRIERRGRKRRRVSFKIPKMAVNVNPIVHVPTSAANTIMAITTETTILPLIATPRECSLPGGLSYRKILPKPAKGLQVQSVKLTLKPKTENQSAKKKS